MTSSNRSWRDKKKHLPLFLRNQETVQNVFKLIPECLIIDDDNYAKSLNWFQSQCYTMDVFLQFMAMHGYTLQRSRAKVPYQDIHVSLGMLEDDNEGPEVCFNEIVKNKQWRDTGNYLPDILKDFHDCKDIFKTIDNYILIHDNHAAKQVNWVQGHLYIIDIFLWFMAIHGYVLRKSKANVPFLIIKETVMQYKNARQNTLLSIINN